jgi:nucleoid-associated protein YgaU
MIRRSSSISLLLSLFLAAGLIGCASTQTTQQTPAAPPPAETKPAPAPQAEATPPPKEEPAPQPPANDAYRVVSGDNLWDISKKPSIYADPYRWPLIYKANQDKINDADLIYPGQVLTITRGNTPLEIDAAIEHARTRGAWTLGVVEQSDRDYLAGRRMAQSH